MSGNSNKKSGAETQGNQGNDWKCGFLSSQPQNHLEILEKMDSGYSEKYFRSSTQKVTAFTGLKMQ